MYTSSIGSPTVGHAPLDCIHLKKMKFYGYHGVLPEVGSGFYGNTGPVRVLWQHGIWGLGFLWLPRVGVLSGFYGNSGSCQGSMVTRGPGAWGFYGYHGHEVLPEVPHRILPVGVWRVLWQGV